MQAGRALLWEYSYKRLQLAQLLGQLNGFLTSAGQPEIVAPRASRQASPTGGGDGGGGGGGGGGGWAGARGGGGGGGG
jgi:hypothetical protein